MHLLSYSRVMTPWSARQCNRLRIARRLRRQLIRYEAAAVPHINVAPSIAVNATRSSAQALQIKSGRDNEKKE